MKRNFTYRQSCPSCKAMKFTEIYKSEFDKKPISNYLVSFYSGRVDLNYLQDCSFCLCECQECGLIFQKAIPNNKLMSVLYEEWIDPKQALLNHHKKDDLLMYSRYAQEISMLLKYFDQIPSSLNFFDFGMGWGKWALMAKGFGCNSFGAELSKDRIEYASSNGINITDWDDIPRNSFDFINTDQVFEHISEPLETLCHLKKGLSPNGIIKISVPTANNIKRRLMSMDWSAPKGSKNSLNAVAPLEHINYFRRDSILKMANLAGMEEVFIPMKTQYMFSSCWINVRQAVKNITLPIYRNMLKRQNYIFLRSIA